VSSRKYGKKDLRKKGTEEKKKDLKKKRN